MEYEDWEPIYLKILEDFGFSKREDELSAMLLDKLLEGSNVREVHDDLLDLIHGKEVFICGRGPSLGAKVRKFKNEMEKKIVVAADGATSTLMDAGIVPDIIVSDLDGDVQDQIDANKKGSLVVLHAHGDNLEAVKKWTKRFSKALGTTQSDPRKFRNLFNFGGFTDGDRAAFLAEHFGARKIYLVAFDFGEINEPPWKKKIKEKKLKWCKYLLKFIRESEIAFI